MMMATTMAARNVVARKNVPIENHSTSLDMQMIDVKHKLLSTISFTGSNEVNSEKWPSFVCVFFFII